LEYANAADCILMVRSLCAEVTYAILLSIWCIYCTTANRGDNFVWLHEIVCVLYMFYCSPKTWVYWMFV